MGVLACLTLAAAVAGAFSGVHPTGTHAIDPLYGALFAAGVTWLASRASREAWLLAAAVATVLSRRWLLLPAFGGLGIAFAAAFDSRARRWVGALMGATEAQVLLRLPPTLFHGLPSVVAGLAVVPLAVTAYLGAASHGRRLVRRTTLFVIGLAIVVSIPVAVAALTVEGRMADGQQLAQRALHALEAGNGGTGAADLRLAGADFDRARSALGAWWTRAAVVVPVVSQERRAGATVAAAAAELARTAERQVGSLDYHSLDYHDGRIDLSKLPPMLGPARTVDRALGVAEQQVRAIRSPWLVAPVGDRMQRLSAELGQARSNTQLAEQAIPVLPDMLGANGPRHYFVAFMTPSEARGLDGFIGAYGELTADDGALTLTVSGSYSDLQKPGIGVPVADRTLTGPADYLASYGTFHPAQYIQDATFSPDFPSVADVLAQLAVQSGLPRPDGVLALDPYAAAALLKLSGPVSAPDLPVTVTPANAARLLLLDQYTIYDTGEPDNAARHDFLQSVLKAAFTQIVHGSLPGPKTLAADLGPPARAGRLSVWARQPQEQALIRRVGLDGAFPQAGSGDLLAVTVQNAAGSKIDAFLHESIADHIGFDPGTGAIVDRVSIGLRNDAPPSGLPGILLNQIDAPAGTPSGANYAMVTVYSPLFLHGVTIDGRRAALTSAQELGVYTYRTWLTVPPRSTLSLSIDLVGTVGARRSLPVSLRLQPGANPESVSVSVRPVPAWHLETGASATWRPTGKSVSRHEFAFTK